LILTLPDAHLNKKKGKKNTMEANENGRRKFIQNTILAGAALLGANQAIKAESSNTNLSSSNQLVDKNGTPTTQIDQTTNFVKGDDYKNIPTPSSLKVPDIPPPNLKANAPFDRNKAEWEEVTKLLKRNYSITSENVPGNVTATLEPNTPTLKKTNELQLPLQQKFMAIDYKFRFEPKPTDNEFRYNHAEALTDQAADLLLRGIRDRFEWNEMGVKAFDRALELHEYWELDKIHQEEINKGFYLVSAKESHANLRSELENLVGYKVATNYLDWLLKEKYSQGELNKQSDAAQRYAFMSSLSAYELPAQGRMVSHNWNTVSRTIPEHVRDAALDQNWFALINQYISNLVQQQTQKTVVGSTSRKIEGLETRADWEKHDVDFRRRRTLVARDLADLKTKAYNTSNGILNYPERMIPVRERFMQDFRDALARIKAAALGLKLLYGYPEPLAPSVNSLLEGNENNAKAFDDCLLWVRDAISWMVRFTQLDQNYVLPLSVKKLINNQSNWEAGFNTGIWSFPINETPFFQDQRHVRLRGISLFTKADEKYVWQSTVTPPKAQNVHYRHLSGTIVPLDQRHAPVCRLSRVSSRKAQREPDVGGTVALFNLSPIGSWTIKIEQNLENYDNFSNFLRDKIEDIHLDLHLAYRSTV
jgi:hypothetical protein